MKRLLSIAASTLLALPLTFSGSNALAGRVGGPATEVGMAPPLQSVYFDVPFMGGEPAMVTLIGDGASALDLRIHDSQGRMISSRGNRERRQVTFQVDRGGFFTIEVVNLGRSPSNFTVSTN